MKEAENRMIESKTYTFGRVVKCYNLPLDGIDDLNDKYEEAKNNLTTMGPRLAGRLDSELEFTNILQSTKIFKTIVDCMQDYIKTLHDTDVYNGSTDLHIISAWINDMEQGEYNPPHTHHDLTGWSTVLFLKVPEFINDAKDPHKFRDGKLGFISHDGVGSTWMDAKVGQFYIFEARHQHFVMPFKVKNKGDIRRSMSFNFVERK